MKTFTYPVFYKILYKYGNIPLSILLFLNLFAYLVYVNERPVYLVPIGITLLLLYMLNKYFFNLYKIIPYRIEADEEKMICTEFAFSKRQFTIEYKNIVDLKGGIFSGKVRGVMRVYDGQNNVSVGFFNSIRNSNALGTLILSKVRVEVYNKVIEQLGLKKDDNK